MMQPLDSLSRRAEEGSGRGPVRVRGYVGRFTMSKNRRCPPQGGGGGAASPILGKSSESVNQE
jgi:hypothetical protein